MRIFITTSIFTILCGCVGAQHVYETAPGAATPTTEWGFNSCNTFDGIGRCKDWQRKAETCINPKGINEPDPVVYCDEIKDGKWNRSYMRR